MLVDLLCNILGDFFEFIFTTIIRETKIFYT